MDNDVAPKQKRLLLARTSVICFTQMFLQGNITTEPPHRRALCFLNQTREGSGKRFDNFWCVDVLLLGKYSTTYGVYSLRRKYNY